MRALSLLNHPGLSRQGVAIGRVCQAAGVHLPARGCGVRPPTRGPALCIPAAPAVKPSGSAAPPCVGSGCAAHPRRKPRTPQPRCAVLFSNRGGRVPMSDSVPLMGSPCARPHAPGRAPAASPSTSLLRLSTSGGSTARGTCSLFSPPRAPLQLLGVSGSSVCSGGSVPSVCSFLPLEQSTPSLGLLCAGL